MRSAIVMLLMLSLLTTLGCLSSATSNLNWSKNIATYASSKDTKFHDDNMFTAGETGYLVSEAMDEASQTEAENYSQATLEWGKPQTIQRIIVKAEIGQLEFFEIQYQDDANTWHTIKEVQNHVKPAYKFDLQEPIQTRKLRLKVPNKWDSRRMGGQKRRTRGEGGSEVASFKQIQEIEVYYALSPEEATTTQ